MTDETTRLRDALVEVVRRHLESHGCHDSGSFLPDLDALIEQAKQDERDLLMPQFDASAKALSSALDEANAEARAGLVERLRDTERVARMLHEAYERLAPSFGYEVDRDSLVSWEGTPDHNRLLVCASVSAVMEDLIGAGARSWSIDSLCAHGGQRSGCAIHRAVLAATPGGTR